MVNTDLNFYYACFTEQAPWLPCLNSATKIAHTLKSNNHAHHYPSHPLERFNFRRN